MLVYCDECGHEFDFSSIKIKSKWIDRGIEKKYYNCPKCKNEFIIVITNPEIRKLMKQYKALRVEYDSMNKDNCNEVQAMLDKLYELLNTMSLKAGELRKQYEDDL